VSAAGGPSALTGTPKLPIRGC